MSWLLFLDESGHDHKTVPYEVRGGVAIHARELWPLIGDLQRLERETFGIELHQVRKEIKGKSALDKDRFRWAAQGPTMSPNVRRRHSRAFLSKGVRGAPPIQAEFTAYGQACLAWVDGMLDVLATRKAALFAAAIPRGVKKPDNARVNDYLRKDHVFLLERFFYFLEGREEYGLIVMDEVEKQSDRRFVRRLERYFRSTRTGQQRSRWIVPAPLFVSSDLTYPVQVADVCIYCINHGFRLPERGMDAKTRPEIADAFAARIRGLQFVGDGYRAGEVFRTYGIAYVPDPYEARS